MSHVIDALIGSIMSYSRYWEYASRKISEQTYLLKWPSGTDIGNTYITSSLYHQNLKNFVSMLTKLDRLKVVINCDILTK